MLCKCNQEDEAKDNKMKMKMAEEKMEQQKETMEYLKNLKVEAESKYNAIKLKVNQLSEQADPLKVCSAVTLYASYVLVSYLQCTH